MSIWFTYSIWTLSYCKFGKENDFFKKTLFAFSWSRSKSFIFWAWRSFKIYLWFGSKYYCCFVIWEMSFPFRYISITFCMLNYGLRHFSWVNSSINYCSDIGLPLSSRARISLMWIGLICIESENVKLLENSVSSLFVMLGVEEASSIIIYFESYLNSSTSFYIWSLPTILSLFSKFAGD